MKKPNVLREKTMSFAIRIVNLFKHLTTTRNEFIMSKQLLRSGISIGANYREAVHAESNADFIHKLSISQKEIGETMYWLELLQATDYIKIAEYESISKDCEELYALITSTILTMKKKQHNS